MAAASLPEQFGRYRILKKLGQGGMGSVFLAYDTQLLRKVGLKVPHLEPGDPTVLQRFYREARAAATLHHPNICPVHDVGEHEGIPYLTMAFIEGRTLAARLQDGEPLPQREAAEIVRKLALALHEAHAKSVIHRDLKPANVMIDHRGEPVVMDFGLARSRDSTRLTQRGSFMGTPAYMPPEQVRGETDAMGPGCDIYSLGVVLYELLTGRLPFEGPLEVVVAKILTQSPPPPSAYRPDLHPGLEAVCLRAMQKEIAARYTRMGEMAKALGTYLRPAANPVAVAAPARVPKPASAVSKPVRPTVTEPFGRRPAAPRAPTVNRSAAAGFGVGCGVAAVLGIIGLMGTAVVVAIVLWPGGGAPKDASKEREVSKAQDEFKDSANGQAIPQVGAPTGMPAPFPTVGTPIGSPATTLKNNLPKPPLDKSGKDKPPPPVVVDDPLIQKMKFVRVSKGTFWMGGGSAEGPPTTQVTIDSDFELAAYTVTQGQWEAIMGSNPSYFSRQGKGSEKVKDIPDVELKRFPVEMVSWEDVQVFLGKLNEREKGKEWKYRLPKEAEWEYACRGAATTKEECSFDFYLAAPTNDLSSTQANFDGSKPAGNGAKGPYLGRPRKVGSYAPNKLGLYDMHGNVWQWCDDSFSPTRSDRVIRGGCWHDFGRTCRAADRYGYGPSSRGISRGFRLARVLSGS
jgi:formylglycine-generating enzyme required for sulfatase activity